MYQPLDELYQDAYRKIRKLIVTKKMVPGELLTAKRLALSLSISNELLDVVLEDMQRETLLVHIPDKGFSVREMGYNEISNMFDCRMAIEIMAVKLFTQNAPQSRIDDLRNLMVPFEKGPQSAYIFQKIDRHFHEIIAKYCGNEYLYELFKKANILSFMDLIGVNRSLKDILKEHLDIISAIHQRDCDKAMSHMQLHLDNTKNSCL